MRRNAIYRSIVATAMAVLLISSAAAQAGPVRTVLYNQPYDGVSAAVPSQIFTDASPDYSSWNTQAFDDFTVTGNGWLVTGATFYGQADVVRFHVSGEVGERKCPRNADLTRSPTKS